MAKKERKKRIRMEEGVRHITCSSACAASDLEQRARLMRYTYVF